MPVPDMDLDASESDSLDIVLSSAAHSRSFAPTVHGSANRNTGVHHPGHWHSESRLLRTQAQPSKRRRVGNSVMVCPSLNCLQQWKLIGRIAAVRRWWCCLGLRSPPTDKTPPERRTIRGRHVQALRKRLENEHAAEEAAGTVGRQGGLERPKNER